MRLLDVAVSFLISCHSLVLGESWPESVRSCFGLFGELRVKNSCINTRPASWFGELHHVHLLRLRISTTYKLCYKMFKIGVELGTGV